MPSSRFQGYRETLLKLLAPGERIGSLVNGVGKIGQSHVSALDLKSAISQGFQVFFSEK